MLYLAKIFINIILVIIADKCYPIQFLGPAENGRKTNYSSRMEPSTQRSGLNINGSLKYLGFKPLAAIPTDTVVPDIIFKILYLPLRIVIFPIV
jgi:hypothetical protein